MKENVKRIKEMFPEVLIEDKIDFEKLRLLLGDSVENGGEKYSFTWNGKTKAIQLAQQPTVATLKPNKTKSKNWDKTNNIYIEGDNLEVLKILQKSYTNKIKMIYLDPPYNTGKDFIYKDDFSDSEENYLKQTGQLDQNGNKATSNSESSGRFHTNWLNMMYPRLKLVRNLLTDDGVVFMSIDDSEQANLKKIADEIFGERNFIGSFVINSAPNGRDYGHIAKMHEFALFYCKDYKYAVTNLLPDADKKFSYSDKYGDFNIHPLYNSNEKFSKSNRPNLYYPFYLNPNSKDKDGFYKISLNESTEYSIKIFPPKSRKNGVQFVWRWGEKKSLKNLNKEIIGYKTNGEFRIVEKMRQNAKVIRSLINGKNYTTRRGTAEVEELMGGKLFDFPKPEKLIQNFIQVGTKKNSIVLDIFSGSATTAEATMKMNAEDGGSRHFIMVQLPEQISKEKIAFKDGYRTITDIAEERIRRAGDKILKENPLFSDKIDVGFKVFELSESNIKKWNTKPEDVASQLELMKNNFEIDAKPINVVYEVMLKQGLDLSYPIREVYCDGVAIYDIAFGAMFVVLGDQITRKVVSCIGEQISRDEAENSVVVLQDEKFYSDSEKLNTIERLNEIGIQYNDIFCI